MRLRSIEFELKKKKNNKNCCLAIGLVWVGFQFDLISCWVFRIDHFDDQITNVMRARARLPYV